jgi:hypothetical protein
MTDQFGPAPCGEWSSFFFAAIIDNCLDITYSGSHSDAWSLEFINEFSTRSFPVINLEAL